MASIEVTGTGLACRNPLPHLISRHAYFPSIVDLGGDELLVTADIGSAFEALDVRSYMTRSTDGGKTWSRPELIFTPDESEHPWSTTVRISKMPDGSLAGLVCLFDRSREHEGLANPETGGFVETQFALIRSDDKGETWSDLEPIDVPLDWEHFETCSPIVPATDRRWLVPSSIWPNWEGDTGPGTKGIALVTNDAGESWDTCVDVFDFSANNQTAWEEKIIRLSDDRLMALCWSHNKDTGGNEPNRFAFSTNDGASFGEAMDTPLEGETCTPLALDDNHVLCVYRHGEKGGLWSHLAKIEGDEWQPVADRPLWGINLKGMSGEGAIMQQMSALKFGYPSGVRLDSGEAMFVFWCVEDCVSSIRWFKLAVETD